MYVYFAEMSLLERLMSQCKIYQKDAETNTYNPDYITKLVNNYRSHKDILHVPNLLFYDNELKVRTWLEQNYNS